MRLSKLTIINYVLFALTGAFGFYLSNGAVVFYKDPTRLLGIYEAVIVLVFMSITLGMLLFINIKTKKYRPNIILISLLGILFLINLITTLTFKENSTFVFDGINGGQYSFDYSINIVSKITYSIEFLALLIVCYLVIDFPYQLFDMKQFFLFVVGVFLTALSVFIIYSYIAEGYKYIELFKHLNDNENYKYVTYSVFVNKNNYAFNLTIGIVCIIYLHYMFRKWWLYLIAGFIYLNLIFTLSKLLLVMALAIVIAYLVYYYLFIEVKNKKRNLIVISIVGAIGLSLATAAVILLVVSNKNNGGYNTIETRTWIWRRCIEMLNSTNWLSGVGYKNFNNILYLYNVSDPYTIATNSTYSAHNIIFELLGTGGIILLIAALLMYVYVIYLAIKNIRNNRDLSVLSLILIVLVSVYSLIESFAFVIPLTIECSALTIFIIFPLLKANKKS